MSRRQQRARDAARAADAKLDELYAQIPAMNCKGLCHHTCGPIDMSDRERRRIWKTYGVHIPGPPPGARIVDMEPVDCPALTVDKRCGVYELRPLICRLWGATERLRCPHGCEPEDGRIDDVDGLAMVGESMQVGGHPRAHLHADPAQLRAAATNPLLHAAINGVLERGAATDRRRAREQETH